MKIREELEKIQDILISENPGFPKKKCSLASKVVFEKLGFLPVSGFVLTSNGVEEHAWNVDSKGKIIDLTFYQFDSNAPKIIHSYLEDVCQDKGYFVNKKRTDFLRELISSYDC